jgi:rhodanese-related sulfurtransferase
MTRLIAVLGLLAVSSTLLADEPLTHTKDSLEEVKANVKAGKALILDVREQAEWEEAHVAGAIHIPKSKLDAAAGDELPKLLVKLDKSKVIYTHCKAGRRALACGELLKKQGYDVRPLKPGTEELLQAGFEKATGK